MRRLGPLAVALLLLGACSDPEPAGPPAADPADPSTTTGTTADVDWPELPTAGDPVAVVTATGLVLPVIGRDGEGFGVVTPCFNEAAATGEPITGAHVVLDPGHGGRDPGAVSPDGLAESDVNLTVAERTRDSLEASGATVVLTRTNDEFISLATRARLGVAIDPLAFVSIHHNAEPDGPWPRPGSETYYQIANPDSKRLAGLLWEELVAALEPFDADWVADTDAGAKYRLSDSGGDYYGILRRTEGITAVLSEAAFMSNPPEAALLATEAFQRAEADAIARAVIRFVTTDDEGSGFTEPYPRPATGSGGPASCADPPLG
ncbi:MAG: N-acetylmuramoyl-L-alanine amidase family protein [Acidimicrobiales bacterium]